VTPEDLLSPVHPLVVSATLQLSTQIKFPPQEDWLPRAPANCNPHIYLCIHMCACSIVAPKNTSIGSRGRRASIVYYYHLQVSFHKHFQTWRQHHRHSSSKPGSCATQVGIEDGNGGGAIAEGGGGRGAPMPVWIEQLLCCVRLRKANILQIKRFSDFVNVGYQFPSAHT